MGCRTESRFLSQDKQKILYIFCYVKSLLEIKMQNNPLQIRCFFIGFDSSAVQENAPLFFLLVDEMTKLLETHTQSGVTRNRTLVMASDTSTPLLKAIKLIAQEKRSKHEECRKRSHFPYRDQWTHWA
jgi:UDP-N-acetylglucosamine 2-epimerase